MYRQALTALAGLSVPGVRHNFDLDALPGTIERAHLPALLVLPLELDGVNDQRRLFGDQSEGFRTIGFSAGVKTAQVTATHLLLYAPTTTRLDLREHLPGLIDLIDAYFDTLAGSVTLGGVLLEPANVSIEPNVYLYGAARFLGCAFRHTWQVSL
jgi:hypothetical protein